MRWLLSLILCGIAAPLWAAEPVKVIRSAKSGKWSEATTWETKQVPKGGDRVLIRGGDTVTYDVASSDVVRGITISGTLRFDPTKTTRLEVGLIVIQAGNSYTEEGFDCEAHIADVPEDQARPALEVGTSQQPISAGHTATIRLHFLPGMNKESCPAIVCCAGRWDSHGQPLSRAWLKLAKSVSAGDTALTVAEPPTGWKIGDKLVITGTQTHGNAKTESTAEERIIKAIDTCTITLDAPLKMSHLGDGEYRAEVANLTRNVVVESADPAGIRGHTMFHRGSAGSLTYSEFRHLGKKDTLGRYALHFHLCGDTMRGSRVIGNSIHDSHNRWLTIHGTNYLIAQDNVGYQSIGHGFFLEDGTEVFNLLDRNLAIQAKAGKKLPKQVLPFDQNEGAGFWWTSSLNTFTRNVAAECDRYGFRYEATPTSALKLNFPIRQADGSRKTVDVRTLPFVKFEDNEVHSSHGLYGVNLGEGVNRVGPDASHPFIVRNLKIWDVHYGFRPQVPNLIVENLHIHKAAYGVYHPHYDNHYYSQVLISQTNTEPFNRGHDDLSVQYGTLTVDGLTFDGCRSGGMPLIQISDDNPTGQAITHIRNLQTLNWNDGSKQRAIVNLGGGPRPTPKSEKGVPIYVHDWFGTGRTAMVVSTKSGEYKTETNKYEPVKELTGNESRATEVKNVAFPKKPEPVDDLPPMTVITEVVPGSKTLVRGYTTDNTALKRVLVNGQPAQFKSCGVAWEVELMKVEGKIVAFGEDRAGNIEKTPATVTVK